MSATRGTIQLGNYLVNAYDVEMTPRSSDFTYFESYDGIVAVKKMLDIFPELTFKVMLTHSNLPGFLPEDHDDANDKLRNDFVLIRRTFLDNVDGATLVVASDMFAPFKGIVSARKYKIAAGEDAEYEITVKGVI